MEDKEAIEQIEEGLKILKRNPNQLYKLIGHLFNLTSHISNEPVKKEIESDLIALQSLTDQRSIIAKAEELIEGLKMFKIKTGNPFEGSFIAKQHGVKEVGYSNQYLKDLDKYPDMFGHIKDVERRILYDTEYVKNHHELIKEHKRYGGYLHARIKKNMRIMYYVKNGRLIFDEIITKNHYDSTR